MSKCFQLPSPGQPLLCDGPLKPHVKQFADRLCEEGYSCAVGSQKIRLVVAFSEWLLERALKLEQLDEAQVAAFLAFRRRQQRIKRTQDRSTLQTLLEQLRNSRVISGVLRAPVGVQERIQVEYEEFLLQRRGLAVSSVKRYLEVARRFSKQLSISQKRWHKLNAKDVTDFVLLDSSSRGRRSAQQMTAALRSFLRFLFQKGLISTNLAPAVPTVAGGPRSKLPFFLDAGQVNKLLRACDRRTQSGKRDYAILLMLARLGLRAGEVAALELDDIDWNSGYLCVRGKGSRLDRLPLLEEVGRALVDYLQKARPTCSVRRVFIRNHAPRKGFSGPSSVGSVVRKALHRAGLQPPCQGAHLLRHSLATGMLRCGATLTEISQVLRHDHIQTTEIYAKVDCHALRALSQPWPGGAQ